MKKRGFSLLFAIIGCILAVFLEIGLISLLGLPVVIYVPLISITILALLIYAVYPYFAPGWVKRVAQNGRPASARLLSGFGEYMQGVGGYEGRDMWIDLPVRVEPAGEAPFEAQMKCRLLQSWALQKGRHVQVRYDEKDRNRVVMVADRIHNPES